MNYILSKHAQEQLMKPERKIPLLVFERVMVEPEQVVLDTRFDKLDAKVDKLAEGVAELKTNLVRVELELKGDMKSLEVKTEGSIASLEAETKGGLKALEEKIDGLGKRVDTQKFINREVIVGLVLTILGGFG